MQECREVGKGRGQGSWELDEAIKHFGAKLQRLEGMMKTESGRAIARVMTVRLRKFRNWWVEENRGRDGDVR